MLLHGDPQLQNVVVGPQSAVLIDLDWLAIGPAIVDVAPVARARQRGQLSNADYASFVEAYGADLSARADMAVLSAAIDFSQVVFDLALACRRNEPVDWLPEAVRPHLV